MGLNPPQAYPRNVPLNKNPFHTLQVTVKPQGLRVSSRNGYYGEAEGADGSSSGPNPVTQTVKKKK